MWNSHWVAETSRKKKIGIFIPEPEPPKSQAATHCVCEKQLYFSSTLNFLPGRVAPACYILSIGLLALNLTMAHEMYEVFWFAHLKFHILLLVHRAAAVFHHSPHFLQREYWECVLFWTQNETSLELEQRIEVIASYTLVCARTKTTVEKWEMASEGNELESKE